MTRKRPILPFIFALCVLLAGPALAEEVIYFTNGTTMPIRGHEVKGEMIHVDLGGDSFMAFPATMVDRIDTAGKEVMLQPSSMGNRIVSGGQSVSASHPARGTTPSRHSRNDRSKIHERVAEDQSVEMDASGVAVYRPHAGSRHPAKARVGLAGNRRVMEGPGDYAGTKRKGNRSVIGAAPGSPKDGVNIMNFEQKQNVKPSTPPKNTSEGDASSSSSGSDSAD